MQIISTAAAGLRTQQTALDLLADNMANLNTPGYKAAEMDFAEALAAQASPGAGNAAGTANTGNTANATVNANNAGGGTGTANLMVGAGVLVRGTGRDLAQGLINSASNPLDLAISGTGYFQVSLLDGQGGSTTAYTRAGNFHVDANRAIVDDQGHMLVPQVTVPAGSDISKVDSIGQIIAKDSTGNEHVVGQIQLAVFPNPESLQDIGDNLFLPQANTGLVQTGQPGSAAGNITLGSIKGQSLEQSNVDLAGAMADLIQAQRAYQLNAKIVQDGDQMWSTANSLRR